MNEIAKNEFYELVYDETKNWIYWTMKGYWDSMSKSVPDFDKDWTAALSKVKPGWKVFANLASLKVMPVDVKAANDAKQQELMQKGCKRVSCIIESSMTKMSLNAVLKKSGMEKIVQYFDKADEAQKWLEA